MISIRKVQAGMKFRVEGSEVWHVAKTRAMACGRGYVRIETIPQTEGTVFHGRVEPVVNVHGSNRVEVS